MIGRKAPMREAIGLAWVVILIARPIIYIPLGGRQGDVLVKWLGQNLNSKGDAVNHG